MTRQVQSISGNIDFSAESLSSNHAGNPMSGPARRLTPSALESISPSKSFGLGLPSPPPEREDEGFPVIHSASTDDLLRSGMMNASLATASNEPDAEAAFFVADLGEVYRQHLRWQKYLPNVTPFYAVKANPDPYVLRLLAALGTGFDCASQNEINMVADLGVDPERVIFANPCKPTSFVKHASRMGVDMTTFDNADELYKIARVHPNAKLVLRILTDDSKSLCRLGLKFGAPLVAVPTLLAKAVELKLDVIGISFHVGSGCYDSDAFADAIKRARMAFEMGREAGYVFTLLDIGGGFESENFEEAAGVVTQALDQHFGDYAVKIIAEPGRFYVAHAFTLAANIIARRGPDQADLVDEACEDENPKVMYYLNDGVYSSFNCIMFDHQTVSPFCLTVGKVLVDLDSCSGGQAPPMVTSSLWGPTCDSIDCIRASIRLPASLEVGDWLGFRKMGAYTICAASRFNGFDATRVVYTAGDETIVEDLIRGGVQE